MTVKHVAAPEPPSKGAEPRSSLGQTWPRVRLGGVNADLLELDAVVALVSQRLDRPAGDLLAVAAVDLDHVHHFGSGRRAARREGQALDEISAARQVEWLGVVTGSQLARLCRKVVGQRCPRVSPRRLVGRLLEEAQRRQLRVSFLCDSTSRRDKLEAALSQRWPALPEPHVWMTSAHVLDDDQTAGQLAETLRQSGCDLLFTLLGKARQERWVAEHAVATGARVCVALGTGTRPLCKAPEARLGRHGQLGEVVHGWWHLDARARAAHAHLLTRGADLRALRGDSTVLRLGRARPRGNRDLRRAEEPQRSPE